MYKNFAEQSGMALWNNVLRTKNVQILKNLELLLLLEYFMTTINGPADYIQIYIHIYIYMCVCVCVCVYKMTSKHSLLRITVICN